MLHQIRVPPKWLSDYERQLLRAIAEAALPAGRILPAAGDRTVQTAEALLGEFPSTLQRGYKALLYALDSSSLVAYRRRFGSLGITERLAVLESWRCAGVAKRLGLRAMLTPLKVAHFDSPELYRQLGCAYEFERVQGESKPRYMRERSHGPDDVAEDMEIECDAVVIGSGAGGAVVAKELAELGHAVVILEEGHYFERRDFTGRPFAMYTKLYRNGGATFAVGNVGIPIPLGRSVGGSTTVNSGTCYRTSERVLAKWRNELGLRDFTEARMEQYFSRVENILGVAESPAAYLGGVARVIARGCDRLGWRHKPLRRNAPDCDGKGVCCFGCPTDAKRSTNVSYVPLALKAGAELFHGAEVMRILTEGTRATGVVARVGSDQSGPPRTLKVRSRVVIVSCGALTTPVLLARNGLCKSSGQLGANLSIHPAAGSLALFGERIAAHEAIPQGYAIEEFHDQGLLFEGSSAPLEMAMALAPFVGPKLIELAESWDRSAMFGFMVQDSSRGRVRVIRGRPVITYVLNDADLALVKRGFELLVEVYLAAGAERIHLPIHGFNDISGRADLDRLRRATVRARDVDLSAYHPLGTARMGLDPAASVVDANHQCHDVRGLYIVDGSAVPTALGVNPQVTIMALATRAAEKIDEHLSRS